ncbi:MAG: DNA polymerase III subunit alpha [Bacillus thermozeamaize]|uniref:DNA polymerase III subunit alpha n=1 Tax=Bacillus thermozeamaize TaxID=230954 RepID=A0A1Y3PHB4_9BACI|nr:MAG: DNA polymerase III subunit alpha [Bacillus thermozeamaize]
MVPSVVHLFVQSEYSLLQSAARIDELVQKAKHLGMKSLGLADNSVMYGTIPFYQACRKAGLHPVIGLQVWVAEHEARRQKAFQPHCLVLLAEDQDGYRSLVKLSTLAQMNAVQGWPLLSFEQLVEHRQGIIVLSGGRQGEIQRLLEREDEAGALDVIRRYREAFGPEHFFLQLEDHGRSHTRERDVLVRLVELGRRHRVPLVAANQVLAADTEGTRLLPVLHGIRDGKHWHELEKDWQGYELTPPEVMRERFAELPWALENARVLAERCRVTFDFDQMILPRFPLPEGVQAADYLRALCRKGAEKRYGRMTRQIRERLEQELAVIESMGFVDYFLIVWDFVRYAHQQGILTGPGRGSAAGSLVAYLLGITKVDPLKYNLLFERFLNPARVTMPDIDIDFSYDRRDEVIRYVAEKYGTDRVAQIITFGTMAARAAVRDVGRVFGVASDKIDRLTKLIPSHASLEELEKGQTAFRQLLDSDPELAEVVRWARQVEGLPRHTSTHAAGVVLAPGPLTDWIPLQPGADGLALTQYPMDVLESLGFLKMDFLGLKNLTIIEKTLQSIEAQKGIKINLSELPDDDPKVYRMLSSGDTSGVFQLESEGMRRVLKEMQPTCFEDIVAVLALYRPGPMDFISHYIQAKHGRIRVTYPHPSLEPILKDTYGIIVYQEQIMQIAARMAGFSLGEADLLRRAVSKKQREVLDEQRAHFVEGCLRMGYDREVAERVYDMIVRFASYGFNRSHAVAYAVIAYQTAYLKAHAPQHFMAALMSESIGNAEKLHQYQRQLRQRGIRLLPPDIQRSGLEFTVEGNDIRYPLSGIKQVGTQAVQAILRARQEGPFKDLFDLCARVDLRLCHRRVLEALIQVGALDSLPGHRAQLLMILDEAIAWGSRVQEEKNQPQLLSANAAKPEYPDAARYTREEEWQLEKEYLGFYLSGHPLELWQERLAAQGIRTISEHLTHKRAHPWQVAGILQQLRIVRTKKGEPMAFAELEDMSGSVGLILFPKVFRKWLGRIQEGKLFIVEGHLESEEKLTLIVEALHPLEDAVQDAVNPVYIRIPPQRTSPHVLNRLKNLFLQYRGKRPVILYYEKKEQAVKLAFPFQVEDSPALREAVERLLGPGTYANGPRGKDQR